MTYKEKLINLLKENPEIKKDLEELKFGCKFEGNHIEGVEIVSHFDKDFIYTIDGDVYDLNYNRNRFSVKKIIGNPLEERHLRTYCEKKKLYLQLYQGLIEIFNDVATETFVTIKYDNTKSFDNQEDRVYEELFNFLSK